MEKTKRGLSRRQMLGATAGAGLFGALALSACSQDNQGTTDTNSAQQQEQTSVELKVYEPTGSVAITHLHAARLDSLENKTIGFVSDDAWEDDRTFALIKDLFAEQYPSVTIITQDNFTHGIEAITKENNGIAEQMQALGVDAAIVGNAG